MTKDNNSLSRDITKTKPRDLSPAINRFFYVTFIVLSIYYCCKGEWMTAASNMGISLIFDPFNQQIKWQQRPLYQRVWLIVHISVVFLLFGLFFVMKS